MNFTCKLVQKQAQTVLSVRTRTAASNLQQAAGSGYGSIMGYLSEIGESCAGAPFIAYYNMDMEDLDIEIGYPVSRILPGNDEVKLGEIPGGKYAECLYTGPYSKCEPAYNALMKWIEENGYKATGICYEFYLNDPADTPENELQTIISFQLA